MIGDAARADERFDVERAERSARALLGDDEFQRAHEAGRCHDDVEALFARIELTTAS